MRISLLGHTYTLMPFLLHSLVVKGNAADVRVLISWSHPDFRAKPNRIMRMSMAFLS
jgi:hypothetical protein